MAYKYRDKRKVEDAFNAMMDSGEIGDHGYNRAETTFLLVERTGVPMRPHTLRDFMVDWDVKYEFKKHHSNRFLKLNAVVKNAVKKTNGAARQEDLFDIELILETVKRIDARQEKLESYLDEERGALYAEIKKINDYLEALDLNVMLSSLFSTQSKPENQPVDSKPITGD